MATDPTGRTSHLPDMHRGQGWKQPVRVATSSNTGPSGLGTVDGVSITSGDRVLLMGQTSSASNGIYVASSGWWPRAHDMDQDATTAIPVEEVIGSMVYVVSGSSNGGRLFRSTNSNTAPTLGTTAISFAEWVPATPDVRSIQVILDGGGSVITTGLKAYVSVPFACTINSVRLIANVSGSIVVDIWRDSWANAPPTDADSITASAPPTLSSGVKSDDITLTGWSTSIAAGDVLAFNVDSASTVSLVTIALKVTAT